MFKQWTNFSLTTVMMLVIAVVATGCATVGKTIDAGTIVAPDGNLRWTHGSVVQMEGTQIVRSTTESCDPATDAAGNIIPNKWTNCRPQDHAASVASGVDDSPGIKATKAAVEIGKAAALAGGMVGAAAVQRPAKTNVTQTQTGASATGGSATNTNTSTNKNCAQSTGAAGNNASPTNCP